MVQKDLNQFQSPLLKIEASIKYIAETGYFV